MPLLGPNLDFTNKDFDSLRERLINLVRSAFPEWTDFNVANFGNIILELFAFVGDVLLYYQDSQAGESRWTTAQLRRSLIALAKLIDFEPLGASAASVDLTFTLAEIPIGNVVIEKGDTFRTLEVTEPIVFQATEQVIVEAGTDPPFVTVPLENSSPSAETFQSTELPDQEYELSDIPFLDNSLTINAGNGEFTEVDDFLDSTSTDRHFTLQVDENNRARFRFGNGINGEIPTGAIASNYKTGGGQVGNVEPGTIRRSDKAYIDSQGNAVNVTVTNETKANGGDTRQSNAAIRQLAPRSLRTLNRTVAREDYETNALQVPGVKRALMLTSNERAGILENRGQLIIIPSGGGVPSQILKDNVLEQVTVTFPNTLTFLVTVIDPEFKTINISTKVFLTEVGKANPTTVDLVIRALLIEFFVLDLPDGTPNKNADFGFNLDGVVAFSDIYNLIRDTPGVRRMSDAADALLLNGLPKDADLETFEFPEVGTITILDAETGLPLV